MNKHRDGALCLSPSHTFVQHEVFFYMPLYEAQHLCNLSIITTSQLALVKRMETDRNMYLDSKRNTAGENWISRFGLVDDCSLPVITDDKPLLDILASDPVL